MLLLLLLPLAAQDFYYQGGKKVWLNPLQKAPSFQGSNLRYYHDSAGREIAVKDEILLQLKEGVALDDLLKEYKLILLKNLGDRIYLLKTSDAQNLFKTAAALYEDKRTLFAQPNIRKKWYLR